VYAMSELFAFFISQDSRLVRFSIASLRPWLHVKLEGARESAYLCEMNFYKCPISKNFYKCPISKNFKWPCPDCPWKHAHQI